MVTKHARHRAPVLVVLAKGAPRELLIVDPCTATASNAPHTDRASHGTITPPSMTAAPFYLAGLSRVPAQDEMTPSRGPVACAAASTSPVNRKTTFRWLSAVFVSMFAGTAHGFLLAPHAAGGVGDMRRGGRGQDRSSCPTSGRIAASVSPAIGCVGFETNTYCRIRYCRSMSSCPHTKLFLVAVICILEKAGCLREREASCPRLVADHARCYLSVCCVPVAGMSGWSRRMQAADRS